MKKTKVPLNNNRLLLSLFLSTVSTGVMADIPNARSIPENFDYHPTPSVTAQLPPGKPVEKAPDLFGETTGPLPFFGKQIRERGYELPDPYGIGYNYMDMHQNINVNSIGFTGLSIEGEALDPQYIRIDAVKTRQKSKSQMARLDTWLLPFMNIYGVIGHTKGSSVSKINVDAFDLVKFNNLDFKLKFKGTTYGGGTTIAYGYHNWFGTADFNYTRTTFDILDGKINAFTFTPRVGYRFTVPGFEKYALSPSHASVWVGTMYQDVTQDFHGNISDLQMPASLVQLVHLANADNNGRFHVKQHLKSPWNMLVGAQYELTRNFNITTEFGFAKRNSLMVGGEFRF